MKHLICICLILSFILTLASCSNQAGTNDSTDSTSVQLDTDELPVDSIPAHFYGIGEDTYKVNIHTLYGTPEKTFEDQRTEQYSLTFLDVKGVAEVTYMNNSDKVFKVSFAIRSQDFDSMQAYDQAVAKTLAHFELALTAWEKNETTENGKTSYQWYNEGYDYAYSMYYTKTVNTDANGNIDWNDLRDATVFQFNRYSIIDPA